MATESIRWREKKTTPTLTTAILKRLAERLRIVHEGPAAPKPGERIGVRLESLSGLLSASDVRDIPPDANILKLDPTAVTGELPMIVQIGGSEG